VNFLFCMCKKKDKNHALELKDYTK
jgi:hypothetical protein